jgi:predicted membrane-bound dolichyl-phosphate-mannose-protein mannosyltransferase
VVRGSVTGILVVRFSATGIVVVTGSGLAPLLGGFNTGAWLLTDVIISVKVSINPRPKDRPKSHQCTWFIAQHPFAHG